jgi:hypothetical protein
VREDALAHGRILAHGAEAQLAAAAAAPQHVLGEHPLHQIGPGEPASTARIVGASDVVSGPLLTSARSRRRT